jgi:glyoxylase-like metal-dependent hydrolase (beta-lactamase superfamily II)
MPVTSTTDISITAGELADRIAVGEAITVLDLREDATWGIEGAGVHHHHRSPEQVIADPAAVAAGLDGPVAVVCHRGMTALPVAQALRDHGVKAAVLEGGMRGWINALQTRPIDLDVEGLDVYQVQRPGRGCLSYLLISEGKALVVDPAPVPAFYIDLAAEHGASVTDVVDTHLHADHLSGARALAERTGAALRLPALALERGVAYADRVVALRDGDRIDLGSVPIRVLALPGHTTDMTGLLVADRALIGGDSLFADGIARPDLQLGDPAGARAMARRLFETLHERVLAQPGDVVLLPGHSNPGVHPAAIAPTLSQVREYVPELAIADPDEFAEALLADVPPRPANYESVIAVNAGTHPFDPELEAGGNSCSTR